MLLVEDDEADAFLVQELLDEANAPVTLTVARTLSAAERGLAQDRVDCVLLDLGLPDAQGLDGLRRLLRGRSTARRSACSPAWATTHIGAAAVAEGAQDYLIKGQVDGTLLARVDPLRGGAQAGR